MLYNPNHEDRLGRLGERLRDAQAIAPKLISAVIAQACQRFAAHGPAAKARIDRLIESGAWTDAALALVELELPQWSVRRLICEGGLWHCSLSKQPGLPTRLDETAEASHESLPLAILGAFVEARRDLSATPARPRVVPQVRPVAGCVACCDNFA
jgi:hypothetical protein